MLIYNQQKHLNFITDLKSKKDYSEVELKELRKLPRFDGVCEFKFQEYFFLMLSIAADDAVSLKYLWRNFYEPTSLNLWFNLTRRDGYFFDIGSHTGIYSIIGNIDKKENRIISLEPYYLNFSRMLSNLKLNKISTQNCFLIAASNQNGSAKFEIKTNNNYHSAGGQINENGSMQVPVRKLDSFKLDKRVSGLKIDVEGHEFEVLKGSKEIIMKYKPDIILEINEKSFDNCLNFLSTLGYTSFKAIDEISSKLISVQNFNDVDLKKEGTNCYIS